MVYNLARSLIVNSFGSQFSGLTLILLIGLTINLQLAEHSLAKSYNIRNVLDNHPFFRFTRTKPIIVENNSKENFVRIREFPVKELNAASGSNIVLTCAAQASPSVEIYWLKDGKKLPHNSAKIDSSDDNPLGILGLALTKSKLFLDCLTEKDAGQYTCVADNVYEKAISNTELIINSNENKSPCINKVIDLISPARITMWTSTRLEFLGSSARLMCRAEGKPRPLIKWLAPDELAIDSSRHKIEENGDLLITNINWDDMGGYTCIAENNYGQDKIVTFLYPTKPDNM